MYEYIVYSNRQGREDITEFINDLVNKAPNSKTHRIELNKIYQCLEVLKSYGTRAGESYTKHLEDDLWELRPTDDRIIYAYLKDNTFILLHHFKKRTQKTPKREIIQAKKNLKDWKERNR